MEGRPHTATAPGDSPWLQLNLYKEDTPIQAIKTSNALDGNPMGHLGWHEVRAFAYSILLHIILSAIDIQTLYIQTVSYFSIKVNLLPPSVQQRRADFLVHCHTLSHSF